MSKPQRQAITGWINLYKPLHITSADAVFQVKKLIHPQKIGHAGTLDPLASGVLPLALGEGTKCVNLLMDAKKVYEFDVTFGEARSTDDAEGEVVSTSDVVPTEEQIRGVLGQFTGAIWQMPPAYSALKVDGKRAYDLARAGEEVVLKARPVTIYSLEFLGWREAPELSSLRKQRSPLNDKEIPAFAGMTTASFRAKVSKGTYIRSLGRDIAAASGSVGYISRLHRAAVGPFTDTQAISLDFLEESVHKAPPLGDTSLWLTPLHAVLDDIPAFALSSGQWNSLRHGQRVTLTQPTADAAQIALMHEGELVGLARIEGNQVISNRLLNT